MLDVSGNSLCSWTAGMVVVCMIGVVSVVVGVVIVVGGGIKSCSPCDVL